MSLSNSINILKKNLKDMGVIKEGTFILRSGKKSNFYIDKDLIYSNPELFKKIIDHLKCKIIFNVNTEKFDVIVGPEKGGLVLSAPIALEFNKIFAFTEKKIRQEANSMVFRDVYAEIMKEKRILIVEDIMTTGGSVSKTINAVKKAKGYVVGIVCIWNRGNIDEINSVPVHSVIYEQID